MFNCVQLLDNRGSDLGVMWFDFLGTAAKIVTLLNNTGSTGTVGTRGTCVHVKSRCKNYIIHTVVLFLLFVKQFKKTLTFYTTLFIDLIIKHRPLCNPHVGFGTIVCRSVVVQGTGRHRCVGII